MNNAFFGKTKEKRQRYQTDNNWKRGNHLVSEPNFYTTKFFTEILLTVEMKKISNINE